MFASLPLPNPNRVTRSTSFKTSKSRSNLFGTWYCSAVGNSSSSTRTERAVLKRNALASNALMADARRGLFDVVVVWRFDRFARSVKQLVLALEEFRSLGIDFVSHQEALDTSTPMGRAIFTIIAAIAELERNIILERVVAGLDYAQTNGTRSGKPIGRPRAIFRHDQVFELRNQNKPWRQIAKICGVGVTTVRAYESMKTKRSVPKPGE